MICSICGGYNVTLRGPITNLTHTECPDCGEINCQEPELDYIDEDHCEECGTQLYGSCPICGAPVCCLECCESDYNKIK